MAKEISYITFGDFLDVYHKIREKGMSFLLSKLKLLPKSRVESKWDSYTSTSDFWLVPEITQSWNAIISGDKNTIYEDYVVSKYLEGKSNLKLISIGCGEGLHDRNFAKHNCFSHIDAVDVSGDSIANARILAQKEQLNIHYHQGDFKKLNFELGSYDVVLFSSSLHHFENVEKTLSDFVKPLLKGDGLLVVFEYCGPNRLQWTNAQLKKSNELLQKLPQSYKQLFRSTSLKKKVYRPGIWRMLLVDPSEAVDSESIVPSLTKHFTIVEQKELGWNILHLLLKGIAHNFVNDKPETKALIADLLKEEMDFVQSQQTSDAIFGVYKK